MEFLKKYLEKRKVEKEKRRKEKFLNTKIPISELYTCNLGRVNKKYKGLLVNVSCHLQGYKVLKKIDDDHYIDVTTNIKYGKNLSDAESGDIVVYKSYKIGFPRKYIEQQYMTISDIIEMNERLKNLEK